MILGTDSLPHDQISVYQAKGWTFDNLTSALQWGSPLMGVPAYMKDPDGRYFSFKSGQPQSLDGSILIKSNNVGTHEGHVVFADGTPCGRLPVWVAAMR